VVTGTVGAALAWVGFVTDQTHSDATLLGMRVIGLLIPAVAFIVSAVLMMSYPLSKQRHEEILAERGTS